MNVYKKIKDHKKDIRSILLSELIIAAYFIFHDFIGLIIEAIKATLKEEWWNGASAIFFGITALLMFVQNIQSQTFNKKNFEMQTKMALFDKRMELQTEIGAWIDKIQDAIMEYNSFRAIDILMEKARKKNFPDKLSLPKPPAALGSIGPKTKTHSFVPIKIPDILDFSTFQKIHYLRRKLSQLFSSETSSKAFKRLKTIEEIFAPLTTVVYDFMESFKIYQGISKTDIQNLEAAFKDLESKWLLIVKYKEHKILNEVFSQWGKLKNLLAHETKLI